MSRFPKTKFSFGAQHHVVGSELQHAAVRAGNPPERAASGDEEAPEPAPGAAAAAEDQAKHHHRRRDILPDEQTDPDHAQPVDAELDRRPAAVGGRNAGVFSYS